MKILIKSLAGGNFHLDAELTDTIGTIKSKIQKEQGHAPELQKIIFSGKILTDDKTVADCNIKEKDFLVVMVSKPKAPKPAAAAPATPAASSSAAVTVADKPAEAAAPPAAAADATKSEAPAASTADPSSTATAPTTTESATASSTTESQQPSGTSGSFLTGGVLESAMQSMMEMGFERDQVQRAMRAAFNNPDRAVEYLMTGIPEHLTNPPPQAASSEGQQTPAAAGGAAAPATPAAPAAGAGAAARVPATPATPSPAGRSGNLFEAAAAAQQAGRSGGTIGGGARGGAAGAGAGAGGAASLLGEDDGSGEQVIDLGNPAMLAQLQQLVQQNPAALQPLVQAIAQSNPQLAEAMNNDPQGVLSLLAGGAAAGAGEEMELPTLAELDDADRTSVEQIVAMGIPEAKAIESYFMCGKNVEMAVQYYFENPQDFED
ncbi:ubiquitin [Pseudozyma hubeiensis SY62]|uniref:UV excision repair protein RAD23 n=1 Tax=Pseudozyma hubeiensis (strain SY62) TaxID=1305764 RepID=R9NWW0_PSEHS|nr:ubiquitin [Pseudozyma hubeiensis SY62]GAC93021.1 ubiquitin [Pseudozyma hubeiensis SY62]